METSAQFLTLVAALSVAAKFVAEWLFGARLDARRMQGAAIGLTVAMLTVCWAVASFAPDLGGPGLGEADSRSESDKGERRKGPQRRTNEQFERNHRLNKTWVQPNPPMLSEGATAEEVQRYNDWERWQHDRGRTGEQIQDDFYKLTPPPLE